MAKSDTVDDIGSLPQSGVPESGDDVLDLHRFASSLYDESNARMDEVEEVLMERWEIPKDVTDQVGVRVMQPVKGRAIIERFRQMLDVGSVTFRTMPHKIGEREDEICSKIERWVQGADRRMKRERKCDHDRDALWWYLFRGRADIETRFDPTAKGNGRFPICVYTDDPRYVYPVRGRDGIMWYTKGYDVYARELRGKYKKKIEALEGTGPNDLVSVVEYWDDKIYMAVVGGEDEGAEVLMRKAHRYGFVPLAEARCLDTPMDSAKWASHPVIGPVIDHLKQVYALASKMATGVNLFYYPMLFGVSASGQAIVVDPYAPGEPQQIAPGTKLEQVNIQVNHQALQMLMGFYNSDINLLTLPETAFGQEPKSLESGFAIAQIMNAVQSAIKDKLPELERAMGETRGNYLRLYKQFASGSGLDWAVPVDYEK